MGGIGSRVVVGLLYGCSQVVVGLQSGYCRVVVRLQSGCLPPPGRRVLLGVANTSRGANVALFANYTNGTAGRLGIGVPVADLSTFVQQQLQSQPATLGGRMALYGRAAL